MGDKRRTKRLVTFAADMAGGIGKSIVKASRDAASIEGAYRFVENQHIDHNEISLAGFKATAEEVKRRRLVLAIEDTTSLSYRHSICSELGNNPSSASATCKGRSLFLHSILVVDADAETVVGLGHQQNYIRKEKLKLMGLELAQRPKEERESYRWEESSNKLDEHFGHTDNVIHVCDREADAYEYIDQHIDNNKRFIVRSATDRKLAFPKCRLHELSEKTVMAKHFVKIEQKGSGLVIKSEKQKERGKKLTEKEKKRATTTNRPERLAEVGISYHEVRLTKPTRVKEAVFDELPLNVVICQELNNPDEDNKLCWYLYTNEPINNIEDAKRIVRYYELRWRIEDFHKVWKSDGTQVEKLRMQTRANMERMSTILAFVAIRLMQLKELAKNKEEAKKQSCERMFSALEWRMLWSKTENKQLPAEVPSIYWSYYALAKLGGWYDSKRTGRVSVKTIWEGWAILMQMLDGHRTMEKLIQ